MIKVLVIEDEIPLLEDLMEMLRFVDYETNGATNGEDGIKIATDWQPDVILCDVMMPGIDGFEVLQRIRTIEATSHVPFIFLTALGDRNSQRHGMGMGADDFIAKPFTTAELLSSINARVKRQTNMTEISEARLERTKQQLARMVTHELRTPLISINTVVEVISRQITQLSPTELAELLQTITIGSKRLTHRVEQLVYITQLESGMLSKDVISNDGLPMPTWDLLVASINMARRFAYRQHANVDVKTQERDPNAHVICNPPALKQSFAEIIANALTFAPENSTVYVGQWVAQDGIWISIADNGCGIDETQLRHALRPFEQVNRDKQEQQGIGLGLTLAQRIIDAHSGKLTIRSVVGKGTQVMINLPIYND